MRVFYTVFFFLSALLCLPFDSEAALPAGVYQAAAVVGTAVSTGGVTSIIPASATAGVPAVGTASAAAGTASTGVAVPLLVGGVALAGGYYVGGMLATDLYDLYEAIQNFPNSSDYPNLKNALNSPSSGYTPTSLSDLPGQGKTISTYDGQNVTIIGPWQLYCGGCSVELSFVGKFIYFNGRVDARTLTGPAINGMDPTRFGSGDTYVATAVPTTNPVDFIPPNNAGMVPPEIAVPNMTNPDGTLKPEIDNEVKNAIASGHVSPSGVTGTDSYSGQAITPEWLEALGQRLAAQNATDVANQTVQQLQDALAADPTNVTLSQQLQQAQNDLAEAQRAQAAAEAAAAEAQTAADTATANLGPANTYDSSITSPEVKNITGLMDSFFSNSPLLGIVRSFQISTYDQQAIFSFGTFWGQEITVDFTRWQSVLAGCGVVLLVLSHAYAVFIVVRG